MTGIENQQNLHGQNRSESVAPSAFTALARELAAFDGLVVGVMEDPAFAGQEEPAGLRCEHFRAAWSAPDVRVVPLTADQIRSHAVVFRGAIDVLVFPYGGVYPMEAFKFYSGQSFQYFLRRGGAVLTTGVPDERTWRIWDAFIYLGHKHGIVYNGDLFTLVPEEMGDPRGWFGTVEAVYDPACRAAQKAFLLALDRRYRRAPGIAWDLFNEPYGVTEASVHEWARDLQAALRADGSDRVLCVGGGPIGAGNPMDFDCPHGRLNNGFVPDRSRAILLQELHVDRPEGLADELEQRDLFREIVVTALKKGACGWMPWSWTRQMRLWQDSCEHHHSFPMEKWDDRLGMHRHEDGTYRPAGILFRDLAFLMQGLEPLELEEEGVIRTSGGRLLCRLAGKDGGGHQLLYVSDGGGMRAMARGRIEHDGRLLLRGPDNAYLFLRQDGPAAPLWFRCEAPGTVELTLVAGSEAEMTDPFTHRRLGSVPGRRQADRLRLDTPGHLHHAWFRLVPDPRTVTRTQTGGHM